MISLINISRQHFKIQNCTHFKSACVEIVLAFYDNINYMNCQFGFQGMLLTFFWKES